MKSSVSTTARSRATLRRQLATGFFHVLPVKDVHATFDQHCCILVVGKLGVGCAEVLQGLLGSLQVLVEYRLQAPVLRSFCLPLDGFTQQVGGFVHIPELDLLHNVSQRRLGVLSVVVENGRNPVHRHACCLSDRVLIGWGRNARPCFSGALRVSRASSR